MYYVKLKKIESTHNNVRTDLIDGLAPELPEAGKRFFMYAETLDPLMDARYIQTTVVQKVQETDEGLVITTENSVYLLTDIEKATVGA